MNRRPTASQLRMLRAFAAGWDAGAACAYAGPGGNALDWRNADRVLGALIRRGWVEEDSGREYVITPLGQAILAAP